MNIICNVDHIKYPSSFQGLRAVIVRQTSVSVAAALAEMAAAALRDLGMPCMAVSLFCLKAMTTNSLQVTSAGVPQEQQVGHFRLTN